MPGDGRDYTKRPSHCVVVSADVFFAHGFAFSSGVDSYDFEDDGLSTLTPKLCTAWLSAGPTARKATSERPDGTVANAARCRTWKYPTLTTSDKKMPARCT